MSKDRPLTEFTDAERDSGDSESDSGDSVIPTGDDEPTTDDESMADDEPTTDDESTADGEPTTDDESTADDEPTATEADPATVTYRWQPDGAACARCGTTTERQWRDDDGFVCADCKAW